MLSTSRVPKAVGALALAGGLALSLSACGGNASANPSASASPAAVIPALSGKMTEVTLDPGFLAGLKSLKLTPAPVGTAKVSAEGVASFPITGGSATYWTPGTHDPYVEGMIKHDGSGLSLTDGKTKVELTNFVIDPAKSVLTGDVSANGSSVAKAAPLFFLDGRTLKPLTKVGTDAILEGTTVSLTKTAAGLLDTTYKTTALTEFFKVGVAKITLATQ